MDILFIYYKRGLECFAFFLPVENYYIKIIAKKHFKMSSICYCKNLKTTCYKYDLRWNIVLNLLLRESILIYILCA